MQEFLTRCGEKIIGVLSGLDRLVLRGTLRRIAYVAGLEAYMGYRHILLKNFGTHFDGITERIRQRAEEIAHSQQRPVRYVAGSSDSKEALARKMLQESPVSAGLIGVLKCVEPCRSFEIHRNRTTQRLELQSAIRKCLHFYFYFLDPIFGFMHARLQTWAPFSIQICLNGREWLARQMDTAGISYRRRENCFVWIEDFARAQAAMNEQLRIEWPATLDRLRQAIHPLHEELVAAELELPYYWSVHQIEWATDLTFSTPGQLSSLYPQLTQYAITQFSSADVMRFLGRRLHGNFDGEITSDSRRRLEGLRVKHRINGNSIKIYDKQGHNLRVETTIQDVRDLKVYRGVEGKPEVPQRWRSMRKSVADLHRLAEIGQGANGRYLDALAQTEERTAVHTLVDSACRPTTLNGRRVRALQPFSEPDSKLLRAVNRGEFVLKGFRNRDLRSLLFPQTQADHAEQKRAAARTGRLLRLLLAHKLIRKLPQSHRYQLTRAGRRIISALLAAADAELGALLKISA